MKSILFLSSALLLVASCTSPQRDSAVEDTATAINENIESITESWCYQRVEGTRNQDSSSVRFTVTGNEVTGEMLSIPFEKDSRKGTLQGSRHGDIIKGVWLFMQEGMQDTLSVEFKLDGDKLFQKSYSINRETGREFLSDTSRFVREYRRIDCSDFPKAL